MTKPKAYHENFAKFFEEPTRDGFRELLRTNVGELRNCDFKADWPENSDLARHVLGMANSGGGSIVVGVKEADDKSLEASGLGCFKDKADVSNGLKNLIPSDLLRHIDVVDFSFGASEYPSLIGKKFQVLFVGSEAKELPYIASKDGSKLRANSIYIRKEGITEEASHDELQRLINSRIDTGYSSTKELDLEQDVAQLKILFASVPKTIPGGSKIAAWIESFSVHSALQEAPKPNPKYPNEGFDDFILKMIELKKARIASQLGVKR